MNEVSPIPCEKLSTQTMTIGYFAVKIGDSPYAEVIRLSAVFSAKWNWTQNMAHQTPNKNNLKIFECFWDENYLTNPNLHCNWYDYKNKYKN